MNCGIYYILNKIYVGSSVNISNRQYKHFWMLKKGIHDNLYLRKSFNKHGLENFVFEILELCTEKDLILKENYYNNNYKSNEMSFGYNLALVGNSRRNIVSNSVKLKLSKFNQQKNNNFSKYSLTNIESTEIFIFESLIDDTNYLISYGFVKGKSKNVRMVISNCLRGRKVDNGGKGTILK